MKGIIIQKINLDEYKKNIYLGCLTESEHIRKKRNERTFLNKYELEALKQEIELRHSRIN